MSANTAGENVEAGRVSGERIATTIDLTDSGSFTTSETVVSTVIAALVTGRTYRVRFVTDIRSTVANDRAQVRLREDNVSGTELFIADALIHHGGSLGAVCTIEAEYTAVAT